jgi:dihydrofolate reductase
MRKVIGSMYTTLDGFISGLNGEMDWVLGDEEFQRHSSEQLSQVDTLLLGRTTYQLFSSYWPSQHTAEADRLNTLPKIVFSRTLARVDWNQSRLVKDNFAEEITALKGQPGLDLMCIKLRLYKKGSIWQD